MAARSINSILADIGDIARYQMFTLGWLFFGGMFNCALSLSMVFAHGNMEYRCHCIGNQSAENLTSCDITENGTESCEYSSEYFTSTIISEFGIIGEREGHLVISDTVYMVSSIPCGLISGLVIDRLGRKKSLMASLFTLGAAGLAMAFSVDLAMYTVFRCLLNLGVTFFYDGSSILLAETTSPRHRPHIMIAMVMSWSAGLLAQTAFAYWLRNWRYFLLALSVPPLVLFTASYWLFDESPHWLVSKNRIPDAQKVVDKITKWNRKDKQMLESCRDADKDVEDHSLSFFGWIRSSPRQLLIIFVCGLGWFGCSTAYTGLAIGVTDLVGNIYINNLIGGLVEAVAYCLSFVTAAKGRRKVYIPLLLIGGVSLVTNSVISSFLPGYVWLIVTTTMIGRLSVSASWQILYMWCTELFPTEFRASLLQATLMFGYIGNSVAPTINKAPDFITDESIRGEMITPIVYGVVLIVVSLLGLLLPETNGEPLPVRPIDATATRTRETMNAADADMKTVTQI